MKTKSIGKHFAYYVILIPDFNHILLNILRKALAHPRTTSKTMFNMLKKETCHCTYQPIEN